jgi:hypothetical protein
LTDQDQPDPAFDTFSARLIRREAQRRAALGLSTATPLGLENALAEISNEVTAEALEAKEGRALPEPAKGPTAP